MTAEIAPAKVLVVDDEPFMLRALERTLSFNFRPSTAESGPEALQVLAEEGPFEVVISDMWMPAMTGAELLGRIRNQAPDTVRILLTGMADADAATGAVNDGQVFRFLTKPCPPETLIDTVREAVDHRVVKKNERNLLSSTLTGMVEILANIIAVSSPSSFEKTENLRETVRSVVQNLGWPEAWKYEVAATLCHLGCVAVPEDTVRRALRHEPLSEAEKAAMRSHPEVGYRLLHSVPRLEKVAEMIRYQASPSPDEVDDRVRRGAQLLRMCLHFEGLLDQGHETREAVNVVRDIYPHELVVGLETAAESQAWAETVLVTVEELRYGMVLDQDVLSAGGARLVSKGEAITESLTERLQRFSQTVGVNEPFRVRKAPRRRPARA